MQYIKHYWVECDSRNYLCETNSAKAKTHPVLEYPGLDVKIWAQDSSGIDICLSEVPDNVTITDIIDGNSGKKAVQKITFDQFSSIKTYFDQHDSLIEESFQAEFSGDESTAEAKRIEAEAKRNEGISEIHNILY
jgi:hypothetical protein